ncbi:DUF1932 domain-containing protein [Streptomyces sp. NPDC001939]
MHPSPTGLAQGRATSYLAETTYIPKVAARSWRWGPEMEEASTTLREAGLTALSAIDVEA